MGIAAQKVVVVTGGSAGVGRATAVEFAKSGASVGLIARGKERLGNARRELEQYGVNVRTFAADVSDADAVDRAAAFFESELGPIDVWVNNAMVSVFSPVVAMEAGEFKRVTDVTYLGYVYGTLAALRRMRPRNAGTIVQVGSALAYRSIPLQSAYCAAKHAISGFTESLRTELLHERSHVRVCQVHLPALNTPQFSWVRSKLARAPQPVPPIFQPEVAAKAIVWAGTHGKRELWVAWPTVKAILAERLVPGLADHYLARYGYDAQQTPEPVESPRTDNLFEPAPGLQGAHGSFDRRALNSSWALEARTHLFAVTAICAAAVAAALHFRSRNYSSKLPSASGW